MNVTCYYGMAQMVGNILVERFCDREPMGIIFRNIVVRFVGCLKFGLFKLV